jgi:hypothetical protein
LLKIFTYFCETVLPPLIKIFKLFIEKLLPPISKLFTVLCDTVLPPLAKIIDVVFEALSPVFDLIEILAESLLPVLNPLFEALASIVEPLAPIFDALKVPLQLLADLLKGIIGSIRWVIQNIGAVFGAGEHISFGEATGLGNFAEGGAVYKSGQYLVGEEGPELITLPAGAYVHTAEQTARMSAPASNANSTIINYTFNSPQALSLRDIRREMVLAEQRQRLVGG